MLNRTVNLLIFMLAICVIGIETNAYLHSTVKPWLALSPTGRLVFYYSFFTVLSNLMLALSCLILVISPNCNLSWFKVVRLNGVVGVLITAVVYNIMLRPIRFPSTPLLQFTNECLHVLLPSLGLLTWLIWGPFARINVKVIVSSFYCLLAYAIYTLIRGYVTGQYPYPFINVAKIGYQKAFYAAGVITLLFFFLSFLLMLIDKIRYKLVR